MKRAKILFTLAIVNALFFSLVCIAVAQVDIGPATVSGSIEADGLPRSFSGSRAKFEEYRDIPETVVVPQLQLMIDGKKNDFYAEFEALKPGLDDQGIKLRAGRYGLIDMEFEWNQIPHLFNVDNARTPYRSSGNGGTLTLISKPTGTVDPITANLGNPAAPVFPPTQGTPSFGQTHTAAETCATNPFCTWLTNSALSGLHQVDLSLLNSIARFKLRYTPSPGWTFTGSYWENNYDGKRAFGAFFGTSPGAWNIAELPEPLHYQTHNIELGGEYSGSWWTLGLKYNASLFHNSVSNLTFDNPANISGVGSNCVDSKLYTQSSATGALTAPGPCRSRFDLYPDNQAHTFTLTGTASLPLKTQFLATVSYGWRLQDDSFLPVTINSATDNGGFALRGLNSPTGCGPAGCGGPTARSLGGDMRPLMVNVTFVNNFFNGVDLKAYYRLYDLANHDKHVTLTDGIVLNDAASSANCGVIAGGCSDAGESNLILAYSRNTFGWDAGYKFTNWLNGKLAFTYDRMHREGRQLFDSNEFGFGPTVDIKPWSWLLVRASYKHFWRTANGYNSGDLDLANVSRMVDQAARNRDRTSLYAQVTPLDNLTLYGGFEFTNDKYNDVILGTQNQVNYSPSAGLLYSPLDWVKVFADYNWDRFSWRMDAMQRSSLTQDPTDPATCDANCLLRLWTSRGRDTVHTISIGSDVDIIRNLLGLRVQYGFSYGKSDVSANGSTCTAAGLPFPASGACTPATDYIPITNMWHELLMRLQYQVTKNLALNVGYYFNHYNSKDFGVDIMRQWMGNNDQWSITGNADLGRSMFLGDQLKGPYTAHVGLVGLKIKF
jgi:hypothetical protein